MSGHGLERRKQGGRRLANPGGGFGQQYLARGVGPVHRRRQAALLGAELSGGGHQVEVALAMRYGEPSIATVLESLRARNVTRVLVLPMYPQYAGSTTATAIDEVGRVLRGWRNLPELRWIRGFHDDPGYVDALADGVR